MERQIIMNGTLSNQSGAVEINELKSNNRLYARLQELRKYYSLQFGLNEPNFFVRVPGRVNIIGEHVDYCGYPVLPMAIDQCIILAVGYTEKNQLLQLRNFEDNKYEKFDCDLKKINIELPKTGGPEWYKYFLCGVKGIYDTIDNREQPTGMTIALSGNIPPASGLSSSSALVSAAALATAHVKGMPLERKNLAAISARCERYIGTQGGGMDQAIAYLAKTGCAQFIEFYPTLKATPVTLPAGACFVVANSLASVNKAAFSDFNERVVDCRLGARFIAKCSQLSNWRDVTRFVQLQELLACTLSQLEEFAVEYLTQDCYTRDEICAALNVTEQELEKEFLTPNTRHMLQFKLRQRTLHVIKESLRVLKFRAICEHTANGNSTNGDGTQQIQILGELMRQSHCSLKELYECSHDDLDRLVSISDEIGVSARLTGAGWGGCIVALCDSIATSEKYIRLLKDKYFAQLPTHILERHQHNDFADVVFATSPCNGAEILTTF